MSEEITDAVILQINSVDFSSYVVQRTYKVQNVKEYAAWVDGNRITHRTLTRQKVTGSFDIRFTNETDYNSFLSAITSATTADDYTAVTLYVLNDKQLMTINAFLTLTTRSVWTQIGTRRAALFQVTVKVEQR